MGTNRPGRWGGFFGSHALHAFLIYLALSLVFTWPLVLHFGTHVPGDGGDDPALVWNLWWVKYALVDLHTNPFATGYMFYPVGLNLIFYTLTVVSGVVSIPLQYVLNIVATANVLLLLSYALAGLGMYLLVLYLLGGESTRQHRLAALLAGLVYAFAVPKLFYAALGQFNLTGSQQWTPFYAIYLIRTVEEREASTRKRYANALLAGLFLLLATLNEFTFGVFLGLFTLMYALYVVLQRRGLLRWGLVGQGAATLAVFLAGMSPVLYLMAAEVRAQGDYSMEGWGYADAFSTDLLGFFVPTRVNTLLGGWAAQATAGFTSANIAFVGYVTLALVLLAVIVPRFRMARFWGLMALAFAVLALGPILHIGGAGVFDFDGLKVSVPLPYAVLHYLPLFKAQRTPNRFSLMLVLALAVLVGYAAAWLLGKMKDARALYSLAGALAVLIALEHAALPLPLSDLRVPAVYEQIAREPGDFAVMPLPLAWRNGFGILGPRDTDIMYVQLYQTTHHKRLLGGNTSRNPGFKFSYFDRLPIARSIVAAEAGQEIAPERVAADKALVNDFIRFYDLRYIVVQPKWVDTPVHRYVQAVFPLEEVSREDGVVAYRVTAPASATTLSVDLGTEGSRLYRGDGWGDEELYEGASANFTRREQATLYFPSTAATAQTIRLRLTAFVAPGVPPQEVAVSLNGHSLGRLTVTPGWAEYALNAPASAVRVGMNELALETPRMVRPRDVLPPDYTIGKTGVSSPVDLEAESRSMAAGNFSRFVMGDRTFDFAARGYDIAVVNPETGVMEGEHSFDTFDSETASHNMAAWMANIPRGRIVLVALKDAAQDKLTQDAVDALRAIGAAEDIRGKPGRSHAIIGVQGAAPGTAVEMVSDGDRAYVHVGHSVDARWVGVAADWIRVEGVAK